ncbi:NAD(P)/FAD-dependent oxidoreductase [Breoghania sp.]|uniref:FAD-dependent oxidoreductase n=1 Tax=Breoghania sp. TaxID=2065378 RepID=UPI002AA662BD|nr:NAD(P)/FAD-dependent oxidoreductase [Breoghania sp.]
MTGVTGRTDIHDVAIVGAGPVGLTLALGLARAGLDVVVLEREDGPGRHPGEALLWPGAQEVLHGLDLLERAQEKGISLVHPEVLDVDHDRVLLSVPLAELSRETPCPHMLFLPQSETVRLLYEEIRNTVGVEVQYATHVIDFVQDSFGVDVVCRRFGHEERVRAKFVAGCDGAESSVRAHLGGTMEGRARAMKLHVVDVCVPGCDDLAFPRFAGTPRPALAVRLGEDLWRLVFPGFSRKERKLAQRVGEASRALFGKVHEETVWSGEFRLERRISSRWFNGRIVLAGDAAHVNSPVGGEGLNSGMGDAELLTLALEQAVAVDHPQPLAEYVASRRRAVERVSLPFADMALWLVFGGGSARVRGWFACLRGLFFIPPLRRRIMRRMALMDRG